MFPTTSTKPDLNPAKPNDVRRRYFGPDYMSSLPRCEFPHTLGAVF